MPTEAAHDLRRAVVEYAGRARAAGTPLGLVLARTLSDAGRAAAALADDEYETLMTLVAAWTMESYAAHGVTPLPSRSRLRPGFLRPPGAPSTSSSRRA